MHSDSDFFSSGPDDDLDAQSEHLWRAEEEAAEEEIRMAQEAAAEAAEELWMAEEAAAQAEMAELEEFAQEAERWMNEDVGDEKGKLETDTFGTVQICPVQCGATLRSLCWSGLQALNIS